MRKHPTQSFRNIIIPDLALHFGACSGPWAHSALDTLAGSLRVWRMTRQLDLDPVRGFGHGGVPHLPGTVFPLWLHGTP